MHHTENQKYKLVHNMKKKKKKKAKINYNAT